MKIALIFTPLRPKRAWKMFGKHIRVVPPLSLAYVAAIAEKAGHRVIIIDTAAEQLSLEDTIKRIRDFSPDICGFTMTTLGFHQTLSWIKKIKEKVKIPVIVGGWHLSIYPQETMCHDDIDYAVIGESENILPDLLKALEFGSSLYNIKGIAFRDNGRVIITPNAPMTADLDVIPFPARHLLDNTLYQNIFSRKKNFTAMLSARGCPYNCIFCDLNTKKFRMRSVKNFVDEIEINYKQFSIREFDIYDSSFTIDRERVIKICDEIIKRKLNIFWTARTRVDNVNKDMLRIMARSGCNTIMYGVESADQNILKLLRKQTNIEMIKDAIKWTRESGIKTFGFFMIGVPGETYETAMRTIRFSIELDLDYVQFSKLVVFPNTEVYHMLMQEGFGDYWREFTRDPATEKELPLIETDLTTEEAMRLVKKAYLYFYFRPAYLWKAFKRLGSILELKNSINAALGLIFDGWK